MREKRISRIFEMLNYYSDTFARISLTNLNDVGEIGVTLISSILNYRVAVLLIEGDNKEPELLASKGLAQDILAAWNAREDLVRHLWSDVDAPTIVRCNSLEANISSSARRLGMGEMFLVVPLNTIMEYKEERIGLAVAACPRDDHEPDVDILSLDIIASLITGAITNCKMRTNLIEINEAMKLEITERERLEDQLRHAHKMEAIGTLTSGIAHEFNNILTAIIGYGKLLHEEMRQDDPLRHNVNQILSSSERAANLTQSLLAFSREQTINPIPVRLNGIIKNIEKLLLNIIGEDIEFQTILTNEDLTVNIDSGQIEQVLMNLVTNARDAMPEGGCLTISTELVGSDEEYLKTHNCGEPGSYALISVTDTGTGMDEKTMERIFEPFFTTKEVGKGTGLGLSMAYGIVKKHNGYFRVYSELGKGTTFKVYLPVIKSDIEETESAAPAAFKGGTETVILAEDDEIVRKLTKIVLDGFGYKVIEAVDGEDAIKKFMNDKDKIQLLILDVVLPKKSGKEAYDEIKKIRPDIKALFTSGYAADITQRKGFYEEEYNFISKPVLPRELLKKVREVLDKRN